MNLLQFLLAIVSSACLLAFAAYISLAGRGGSLTLYSTLDNRLLDWKKKIFLGLAAVGFLTCMFKGAETMLWWMPSSWGYLDEEREYQTLRVVFAGLFATVGGLTFIGFIDKATHNSFFLEILRVRSIFVERLVSAIQGKGSFGAIRDDLNKKLKELELKRDPRSRNVEIGHLFPDGERSAEYTELLHMLDIVEGQRNNSQPRQ